MKNKIINNALKKYQQRANTDYQYCDNQCKRIINNITEDEFFKNRNQCEIYESNTSFYKYCYREVAI